MYSTSPNMFEMDNGERFERLTKKVRHSLFGTDCIGYGLLASGFTDIVCEAQLKHWDYAAHVPIIEGAGGIITDWNGKSLTLGSSGTVLASGDRRIHDSALTVLSDSDLR